MFEKRLIFQEKPSRVNEQASESNEKAEKLDPIEVKKDLKLTLSIAKQKERQDKVSEIMDLQEKASKSKFAKEYFEKNGIEPTNKEEIDKDPSKPKYYRAQDVEAMEKAYQDNLDTIQSSLKVIRQQLGVSKEEYENEKRSVQFVVIKNKKES
ncbi:hypothetical protein GF376_00025 [Candidatus Peregrinibacteria bacterium]|nr:hypothetical protein [Candidatus Peregrinibacteria bacterium]